jgi:hypothetical protein
MLMYVGLLFVVLLKLKKAIHVHPAGAEETRSE